MGRSRTGEGEGRKEIRVGDGAGENRGQNNLIPQCLQKKIASKVPCIFSPIIIIHLQS